MSQYKLTIWPDDESFAWFFEHEFCARFREFRPVSASNPLFVAYRLNLPLFNKLFDYFGESPFSVPVLWSLAKCDSSGNWVTIIEHFPGFDYCQVDGVWHHVYGPSTPVSMMRSCDLSESFSL